MRGHTTPARWRVAGTLSVLVLVSSGQAFAHGFVGERFFPATLAVEDPFVADELSLPTFSTFRHPAGDEGPSTRETSWSVDLSKRITSDLAFGLGWSLVHLNPRETRARTGFENLEVSLKYQLFTDPAREMVFSIGVDAEIGGTGNRRIGAESFSTITPTLFFGKGFGDLPDSVAFLKPFAITAAIGVDVPTRSRRITDDDIERFPHVLQTGFTLQYSLPYYQSKVKDVGKLGEVFRHLIPLVEVKLETPLDRGQKGKTTGTINPGLLWVDQKFQFGVEALIPVNRRTGHSVGVIAQLHFFLDDVFPTTLGKPIFGK